MHLTHHSSLAQHCKHASCRSVLLTVLLLYVVFSSVGCYCVGTVQLTYSPAQPLIDLPFTVTATGLAEGAKLYATKMSSVCTTLNALGAVCTVNSTGQCTFTITRSSLDVPIQDDSVQ
uniref:Uncharacterized protein n=1 Tax=Lygus hesperus TaxID=30085 RepID=A0A146LWR6_LYGHE